MQKVVVSSSSIPVLYSLIVIEPFVLWLLLFTAALLSVLQSVFPLFGKGRQCLSVYLRITNTYLPLKLRDSVVSSVSVQRHELYCNKISMSLLGYAHVCSLRVLLLIVEVIYFYQTSPP